MHLRADDDNREYRHQHHREPRRPPTHPTTLSRDLQTVAHHGVPHFHGESDGIAQYIQIQRPCRGADES